MSYLLTQMFLYLIVAVLLGLLLGWLIWRFGQPSSEELKKLTAERDALVRERDDLKTNLDACRSRSERDRDSIDTLRADKIDLQNKLASERNNAVAAAVAAPIADTPSPSVTKATKPEGLSAPRGGMADDLKEISGVGPKMEKLLHKLGYFHFDQVAAWSASDVAWVDENLEGFKGRVSRDDWVPQAKKLARQ